MNGIMTGLPLNHVLDVIERNLQRLSGSPSRIWTERAVCRFCSGLTFSDAWFTEYSRYCAGAVFVTHFERRVEVIGCSNVLKFSIVSLDLHREEEIIPRDILKCKKEIRNR